MEYRVKVSAINLVGEGANSTEGIFLCAETPVAPGQPKHVSSTETEITIRWTPPVENGGSPVLTYEIFSKLSSESE